MGHPQTLALSSLHTPNSTSDIQHQTPTTNHSTSFPVRLRYLPRSFTRPNKHYSTTDEMGDANITTSAWRLVEVGRVVLFNEGVYEGRLATIVEIIDHKRVRRPAK